MSDIFGEILKSAGEKVSEKVKTSLDFSAFLQNQLSELETQYEQDFIPEDLYEETKANILGFFQDFGDDFDVLKQKILQEKQEILKQTGLELSGEKQTLQIQTQLYESLDINRFTYQNSRIKQWMKGALDVIIVGNAELIEMVAKNGIGVILDGLKQLFTWSGVKELLKSIGGSISDLFSGDSYKIGYSMGELGMIGTGVAAGMKGLKHSIKIAKKLPQAPKKYPISTQIEGKTMTIQELPKDMLHTPNQLQEFLYQALDDAKKSGKEITEIDLGKNIDSHTKELLHNLLSQNYPALSIARLTPGDSVVNFTFGGVKQLNDSISKEFVDLLNDTIKSRLAYAFGEVPKTRMVRENYKHQTFSLPQNSDISGILQRNFLDQNQFIRQVFDGLSDSDILQAVSFSKNPEILGMLHQNNIPFLRKKLLQEVEGNLKIGVGKEILPTSGVDFSEQLQAFYKAEMSAKKSNGMFDVQDFDIKKLQNISQEILRLEQKILKKYTGKGVMIDDILYPILAGNAIHPTLLKHIRKGTNIGDAQLQKLLEQYTEMLNTHFDFISPVIGKTSDVVSQVNDLNTMIQSGKISVQNLMHNYKGTYTPEALEFLTKDIPGQRIFIDVVDMGGMNLQDFRRIAGEVANSTHTGNYFDVLLKSGAGVTQKLLGVSEQLKKKFGAQISIVGDEVFVFLPDNKKFAEEHISQIFSSYNLKTRLTSETQSFPQVFQYLDAQSQLLKPLENVIEKAFFQSKKHNSITSYSLDIGKKMDFDDIFIDQLVQMLGEIPHQTMQDFLINTQKSLSLGQIDKTRIILKRQSGNHITLSFET